MEKQIVPDVREEIKKLQEALKRKSENLGSADDLMTKASQQVDHGNGSKPVRNPDEQTADNFVAVQANTKKPKR